MNTPPRIDDVRTVFDQHRVENKTEGDKHCRPGWVQLACPWCNDGKFHLGVHLQTGRATCYGCGSKRLSDVFRETCRISNREAVRYAIGFREGVRGLEAPEMAPQGRYTAPKGVKGLLAAHREYLALRGFNAAEIERVWKVQGIGLARRLCWRLFIPVLINNQPVSWQTRSISQYAAVPYINAKPEEEKLPIKSVLYGEDYVGDKIVVHEGALDVWATGPGAVATLGVGFTMWQVIRLSRYPKRYIAFDNEPTAQKRAEQLADHLRIFDGKTYIVQIDAKDMAAAPQAERLRLRKMVFGKSH